MNFSLHIPQVIIGILFVGIFAATLYIVLVIQPVVDDALENVTMILVGVLATNTTAIVNYFFGSSSGSKEKTAKMNGGSSESV